MQITRKVGKHKVEASLSRMQLVAIIAWSLLLLLIPISIDQISEYKKSADTNSSITETKSEVAGIFTEEANFFTYTIDIKDDKELISALTLIVGSVSALIALGSAFYFVKDSRTKERSVFGR